jgi:hypothetical protein
MLGIAGEGLMGEAGDGEQEVNKIRSKKNEKKKNLCM